MEEEYKNANASYIDMKLKFDDSEAKYSQLQNIYNGTSSLISILKVIIKVINF